MVQKPVLVSECELEQAHYTVMLQVGHLEDHGPYNTYGLMAMQKSHEGWYVKTEIHDITTNLVAILHMASTFNSNKLSMIHFHDAVEDWLVTGSW